MLLSPGMERFGLGLTRLAGFVMKHFCDRVSCFTFLSQVVPSALHLSRDRVHIHLCVCVHTHVIPVCSKTHVDCIYALFTYTDLSVVRVPAVSLLCRCYI